LIVSSYSSNCVSSDLLGPIKSTQTFVRVTPEVASMQLRPVGHRRIKRAICNEWPFALHIRRTFCFNASRLHSCSLPTLICLSLDMLVAVIRKTYVYMPIFLIIIFSSSLRAEKFADRFIRPLNINFDDRNRLLPLCNHGNIRGMRITTQPSRETWDWSSLQFAHEPPSDSSIPIFWLAIRFIIINSNWGGCWWSVFILFSFCWSLTLSTHDNFSVLYYVWWVIYVYFNKYTKILKILTYTLISLERFIYKIVYLKKL